MEKESVEIQDVITQIESFTRAGNRREAVSRLIELRKTIQIPRKYICKVAELARRNGMYLLSLRLLKPLLHPQKILDVPPTDLEKVTYSAALVFLGATGEAKHILHEVDTSKEPKALLYLAFGAIHEWDYQSAAKSLKRYIQITSLTEYEKLVAMVNLLSCCVALDDKKSGELYYHKIMEATQKQGYKLLQGNSQELFAQFAMNRQQYDEAIQLLKSAEENLGTNTSIYLLLVKKWQLFIQLQTKNDEISSTLTELQKLKELSLQNRYWELVRDIDLMIAVTFSNQELFNRAYLGTPFKPFKKKALRHLTKTLTPPISSWIFYSGLGTHVEFLDLTFLKRKKNSFLWLQLLTQDLYKPVSLGKAYEYHYPNEYFNADTSPKRLLNSAYRFNKVMTMTQTPLRVVVEKSEFVLKYIGTGKCFLYLNARGSKTVNSPLQVNLEYLRIEFSRNPFSTNEVAKLLNLSRRGALDVLLKALKSNELKRLGSGPMTRYTFTNKNVNTNKAS